MQSLGTFQPKVNLSTILEILNDITFILSQLSNLTVISIVLFYNVKYES